MTTSRVPRVLLLFLDGVGIGEPDPAANPFLTAKLPHLRSLLGGEIPTLDRPELEGARSAAFPLDAALGVPGVPQSGTGQTTLLTGENAAAAFGRHFGPWTPVSLRPLLERRNLLRLSVEAGHATVFANAYPRSWPGERAARRSAAPPLAARSAGLLDRHEDALARGDAVASEILNDGWRAHLGFTELPVIAAEDAGRNLAKLASAARLTLFAHYSTDHAGHRGGMEGAMAALELVDAFLAGVLANLPYDALLLIASDHGNIEDVRRGHTLNPVLGVLHGPDAAERRKELRSLVDVAPAVLRWLE
jgi:2,3-bisphosphoglycerate-independent phosphoglycerate mutase